MSWVLVVLSFVPVALLVALAHRGRLGLTVLLAPCALLGVAFNVMSAEALERCWRIGVTNPVFLLEMAFLTTTLAGLVVRRRWRLGVAFLVYVSFDLVSTAGAYAWPERLVTKQIYMTYEGALDLLKLAIAVEIGNRTFRLFPGARKAAEAFGLLVLSAAAILALRAVATSPDADPYVLFMSVVGPTIRGGLVWLMASILVVASWYRVPIHPFHRVLLVSFVAYLAWSSALLTVQGAFGFMELRPYVVILDGLGYQVAACAWLYAACRAETMGSAAHAATLRRVQLEFDRDFSAAQRMPS